MTDPAMEIIPKPNLPILVCVLEINASISTTAKINPVFATVFLSMCNFEISSTALAKIMTVAAKLIIVRALVPEAPPPNFDK